MTKAELIERVAKDLGPTVTKKLTAQMVESVFEQLHRAIRKGDKFTYPGFGSWKVQKRKARKGRNLHTGEIVDIPRSKTVSFKPAPSLKAKL